jgi:hypothetical protein
MFSALHRHSYILSNDTPGGVPILQGKEGMKGRDCFQKAYHAHSSRSTCTLSCMILSRDRRTFQTEGKHAHNPMRVVKEYAGKELFCQAGDEGTEVVGE